MIMYWHYVVKEVLYLLLCCAQLVSYILATLVYNFPAWLSFPTVTLIFTDIFSVERLLFAWVVWQLLKHFVFVWTFCFGAFGKITIAYSLFLLVNQGIKTFFFVFTIGYFMGFINDILMAFYYFKMFRW